MREGRDAVALRVLRGAISCAWFLVASAAHAGPVEEGRAAWQKGDFATAMAVLRPEAEKGDASALFLVGVMYDTGQGVAEDIPEAIKWFRLAADKGNVDAMYSLGQEYALGEGVPKDLVEAYFWLDLAVAGYSASGDATAQNASQSRDLVARKLTPAQLADTRARIADWQAAH